MKKHAGLSSDMIYNVFYKLRCLQNVAILIKAHFATEPFLQGNFHIKQYNPGIRSHDIFTNYFNED